MRILVTVGTTPFDDLVRVCDEKLDAALTLTIQISNTARYVPKRFPYFRFADKITPYYESADLVIAHAGAGTVFRLLDMGKRLIVVPNLKRDDCHQKDLAAVVARKKWALVCWRLEDLPGLISGAFEQPLAAYERQEFFGGSYINRIIDALYGSEKEERIA